MIVIVKACICSPSLTRQLHYHSQLDKSAARSWKSNEDTFALVTASEALVVGPKSRDHRCVEIQQISISSCGTAVRPRLRRLLRACFLFLSGGRESTVTGRPGGTLTCPLAATHSTALTAWPVRGHLHHFLSPPRRLDFVIALVSSGLISWHLWISNRWWNVGIRWERSGPRAESNLRLNHAVEGKICCTHAHNVYIYVYMLT